MSTMSVVSVWNSKRVSEDQLKTPFSSDHANRIAMKITAWKVLAPYIGLDEVDKEEILEEGTIGEQRVKMMRMWRQKFRSDATYWYFVKGCEQAQRLDLVEAVCDLVKENTADRDRTSSNAASEISRLDKSPTMPELYFFTGRSGKRHRILDRISPYWEEFAFALQFETYITEAVKRSSMFQVNDCCRSIVQKWLQGYPSSRGPVTWNTFLSAMGEVEDLTVYTAELRAEF